MDILKKYNEETSQAPQLNLSQEYGALTNAISVYLGVRLRTGGRQALFF